MLDPATQARVDNALQAFWGVRAAQHATASQSVNAQGGTRSAVVGGGHLNAVQSLVADEFVLAGHDPRNIHTSGRSKTLPGWFRPTKSWDLVVTDGHDVVAALEFKSQVGSIGNNANNRAEEAIGNATDVDHAFNNGLLGPNRPWLGYVYVTEDIPASWAPSVRLTNAHYPQRLEFAHGSRPGVGVSYIERFALLGRELVDAGLYQATWVAVTTDPQKGRFSWQDASSEVTYEEFQWELRNI